MDSEGKFWVSIWSVIGLVFLGVIFLSTSYWIDHNKKIVDLIGAGVDPVAAMCAMQDDYGTMPVCIILAVKK